MASAFSAIVFLLTGCGSSSSDTPTNQTTPQGMPHVQGAQILDGQGNPLRLRGAMMPSSFAVKNQWQSGDDPTQTLNTMSFQAMRSWNMNALRINFSYWIYQLDPPTFMGRLDQVIQQANQAGLYVIMDFHDDARSGSPYADGMMHAESLTFWTLIATHFKDNPMVMFDPINEPKYTDWTMWLHGDGSNIKGFQDVIDAIRAAGAQQIIVVEPGQAGGTGTGWASVGVNLPKDPNIVYSLHSYGDVVSGDPTTWDAKWGPILGHCPIYYGEWAVLPHPYWPSHCTGLTSDNADAITKAFLDYLESRQAHWTAWDFEPVDLIQDDTSFAPTNFQAGAPWTCAQPAADQAGMGQDVKDFLTNPP